MHGFLDILGYIGVTGVVLVMLIGLIGLISKPIDTPRRRGFFSPEHLGVFGRVHEPLLYISLALLVGSDVASYFLG